MFTKYEKKRIRDWPNEICGAVRSLVREKLQREDSASLNAFLSLMFCISCGSEFHKIEAGVRNEFMYCVVRIGGRIRFRGLCVLYVCFGVDRGDRILVNGDVRV